MPSGRRTFVERIVPTRHILLFALEHVLPEKEKKNGKKGKTSISKLPNMVEGTSPDGRAKRGHVRLESLYQLGGCGLLNTKYLAQGLGSEYGLLCAGVLCGVYVWETAQAHPYTVPSHRYVPSLLLIFMWFPCFRAPQLVRRFFSRSKGES